MDTDNQQPSLDSNWLLQLRQRFAEITARRVPADAVEDVVHDALGVVLAKGLAEAQRNGSTEPSLRWCSWR